MYKILIIDDEKYRHEYITSLVLAKLFNPGDLAVDSAFNATEAQRLMRDTQYDLVFFDHDLGDYSDNGSQIVSALGNSPDYYKLPKAAWVHSMNYAGARNIASKLSCLNIPVKVLDFSWFMMYSECTGQEIKRLLGISHLPLR